MLIAEQYKIIKYIIPIFDILAWSGFSNQPTNDGVEIISNNVGDTGLCTIFGTTHATGAFAYETVTLTGTTVKATTKTDWGNVYGIFLGDIRGQNISPAVGTITIREKSADQTITTIAATKISTGMVAFKIPGQNLLVENLTGNTWFNTVQVPTITTGGAQMEDRMSVGVRHIDGQYLYLIGDTTGSTAQVYVYQD